MTINQTAEARAMNPAERKLAAMTTAELVTEAEKLLTKLQAMDYRGCYWDANIIRKLLAFAETPAPPSTASSEGVMREALEACAEHIERLATIQKVEAKAMRAAIKREPGTPYAVECHHKAVEADEQEARHRKVLDAARAALTHPHPSGGVHIERIAVGLSDKIIQRLDVDEDDPRLSKIIDELRDELASLATPTDPSGEVERVADAASHYSDAQIEEMRARAEHLRSEIRRCTEVIEKGAPDSWWYEDRGRFQQELDTLTAALRPQDVQASGQSLASKGASNG